MNFGRDSFLERRRTPNVPNSPSLPHHDDSSLKPSRAGRYFPPGGLNMTTGEWRLLFAVLALASTVRLFKISTPASVVFDEVHFGKFAGFYINRQYFVDVHPPLIKLLFTFIAYVFGYDGNFIFQDVARPYDDSVPYTAMRVLPASFGVLTVALSYLTMRALDCRVSTALLASFLVTFENGLITQSRHIIGDSILIFFTALTLLSWLAFCNEHNHWLSLHHRRKDERLSEKWWLFLFLSGLSLGAALSCKWVGLFSTAMIGLSTLAQLWSLLRYRTISRHLFLQHFMARALCLIVVPACFYMAMFGIHFSILTNSGQGDGYMSPGFQHGLEGNGMRDTFADVAIGSKVTIRHLNSQGGLLHSHTDRYPTGSGQQQVTLYRHQDDNNEWLVLNAEWDSETEPFVWLRTDMRIRLHHLNTGHNLRSHNFRPPVSNLDFQHEVCTYDDYSNEKNDWILEIESGSLQSKDEESWKRVRTLQSVVRFKHALMGCYLSSHKVKLPPWGYQQQEVTCDKNADKEWSLWVIETASHSEFPPDAEQVKYTIPSFLSKLWELHQIMWTSNKDMTDRHAYDSRPQSWPVLRRGMDFWFKGHRQIYLIGNPMVWWLGTAAVLAYVFVNGALILRAYKGWESVFAAKAMKYSNATGILFLGWALHYFPFFLMERQLFLHHYLPALYFSILLFCASADHLLSTLRPGVRLQITGVLILGAILCFFKFSALAYGGLWTREGCESAKWLKTWDFVCRDYLHSYEEYETGD